MGKNHALAQMGLLWAGVFACATQLQGATESRSDVFVGQAAVIRGSSGSRDQLNYFTVPVLPPAIDSGVVTALGAGSLTDSTATWSNNQFNGANGEHYLEFDSGAMADILTTSATTKTLTYPGTLPASVVVGSKYKIRKHRTLASLFGSTNQAGLLPGSSTSDSDNVILYLPDTKETVTFFYSSVPGFTGWYRSDYAPAPNTVIYPEQGIMVKRKNTGDIVLYAKGNAHDRPLQVPIYPGWNHLGTLKAKTSVTLASLNLYTGNASTGLAAGLNEGEADSIILINPDGSTRTIFYLNYPGSEGWVDTTYTAAGNMTIVPNALFVVKRRETRTPFLWSVTPE